MALFPLMQKYHSQLSCNLNTHIHTPSQTRTHLNTRFVFFLLHKSTLVVLKSQSQSVISPKVMKCDSSFTSSRKVVHLCLTTCSSTHSTHSYTVIHTQRRLIKLLSQVSLSVRISGFSAAEQSRCYKKFWLTDDPT